jgi:hypothetical protein
VNSPAGALNDRVAGLMTEVLQVCTEAEVTDLVDRINAEVGLWSGRDTVLVVAGETNRGKSALINALVGDDILPADSTRVTGTYVVLRYGEAPMAQVFLDGRDDPLTMPPDEAGQWILTGSRVGDEVSVRAVDIALPSPFLAAGLTIVDTPGAGGLDAAHGRVTLATLARADALLFVLDPSAPVSEPELDFLQRAAARIDTVLLTLTKTDAYRGWREIAGDDRRLIASRAPRFGDLTPIPTSARLQRAARELAAAGTPDEELAQESGVPALTQAIDEQVRGHAALLRLGNLLRLADHAIDRMEAPAQTVVRATGDNGESTKALDEAQYDLDEFRDVSERLQVMVTDRFNQLRDVAAANAARMLREVTDRYEAAPETSKDGVPFVERVEADVQAVDLELSNLIQREVDAIVEEVGSRIDVPAMVLSWNADPEEVAVRDFLDRNTAGGSTDPTVRMRLVTTMVSAGTSSGIAINYMSQDTNMRYVGALMGAAAMLGVLTTAVTARFGRKQRDIQALRLNVRGAIDNVRNELTPIVRQRVLAAQREVEATIRSHVRHKTRDLQAALAECQQLARADATARAKARGDAERRLARLAQLRASVESLTSEVNRRRAGTSSARSASEVTL